MSFKFDYIRYDTLNIDDETLDEFVEYWKEVADGLDPLFSDFFEWLTSEYVIGEFSIGEDFDTSYSSSDWRKIKEEKFKND